jgi:hypothetical protein
MTTSLGFPKGCDSAGGVLCGSRAFLPLNIGISFHLLYSLCFDVDPIKMQ